MKKNFTVENEIWGRLEEVEGERMSYLRSHDRGFRSEKEKLLSTKISPSQMRLKPQLEGGKKRLQ